ncbi:MAG: tail fiber protein [Magnetospirillum sp.]|nr:tail fiber protein [Magnetospirillum sp.]
MSDPYIGQIELFAFSFAPFGWHFCDGTLMQVGQFQALYSLLSTRYGGDGRTTFGLPDLRGRTPAAWARVPACPPYRSPKRAGSRPPAATPRWLSPWFPPIFPATPIWPPSQPPPETFR